MSELFSAYGVNFPHCIQGIFSRLTTQSGFLISSHSINSVDIVNSLLLNNFSINVLIISQVNRIINGLYIIGFAILSNSVVLFSLYLCYFIGKYFHLPYLVEQNRI